MRIWAKHVSLFMVTRSHLERGTKLTKHLHQGPMGAFTFSIAWSEPEFDFSPSLFPSGLCSHYIIGSEPWYQADDHIFLTLRLSAATELQMFKSLCLQPVTLVRKVSDNTHKHTVLVNHIIVNRGSFL